MKRLTILATLLFAAVSVSAQDYHIKLWDNTTAPTSNGVTGDEYERKPGTLTNTSSAEIWIYKPAPEKATGQAIVFCPGGGYSQLSIANGHNTCKWFAENGIVGVMLKYRLPNGHSEVPLNDLDKAVATVREMAGELGVDPHKVGVAGTSAGGYLGGAFYQLYRALHRASGGKEGYFGLDATAYQSGAVDAQMRADYIAYASSLARLGEKDEAFASMEDEALAALYPGLMQSVTQVLHSTEEKTNSLLGRK